MKKDIWLDVAIHVFDPSTRETGRLAWSIERVPGRPGIHRETLPPGNKKGKKKEKKKDMCILVLAIPE